MGQLKISVVLAMPSNADLESVRKTLDSFCEQDVTPRQIQIVIYGKQPMVRRMFIERYKQRKESEGIEINFREVPLFKDRIEALKHGAGFVDGLFLTFWEAGTVYHKNTLSILRAGLVVAGPGAVAAGDGCIMLGLKTWKDLVDSPVTPDRILAAARKAKIPIGEVAILASA